MVFGNRYKGVKIKAKIYINNELLEIVKKMKFLGIILDSALNWHEHLIYTSKKVAKTIGILSRARQYLNKKTLTQLYYSFAYPYLVYCNIIWGNASKINLWPLFKIQKMAIRMISNTNRRASSHPGFKKLKII